MAVVFVMGCSPVRSSDPYRSESTVAGTKAAPFLSYLGRLVSLNALGATVKITGEMATSHH